jgi:hypothetical protein
MSLKKHRTRARFRRNESRVYKAALAQARRELMLDLLERGQALTAVHSKRVTTEARVYPPPLVRTHTEVELIRTMWCIEGAHMPPRGSLDSEAAYALGQHIIAQGFMTHAQQQHGPLIQHTYTLYLGREIRR